MIEAALGYFAFLVAALVVAGVTAALFDDWRRR